MPTPTPGAPAGESVPVPTPAPTPTPGAPTGDAVPTPTPGATGDFQKAIDAIIARERRDAAAALAARDAEIAALNEKLKAPAPKPTPTPEDPAYAEAIRAPLLAELEGYKTREAARVDAFKLTEVKAIAKEFAVEGAEVDVAEALKGHLKVTDDGKLEVVDATGKVRYGLTGPMTPKELVVEHFKAKPYLAKPTVRSGLGIGNTPASTDTLGANVDALKAQIAEAESKQNFALAGQLKSKLLEAQRAARK